MIILTEKYKVLQKHPAGLPKPLWDQQQRLPGEMPNRVCEIHYLNVMVFKNK